MRWTLVITFALAGCGLLDDDDGSADAGAGFGFEQPPPPQDDRGRCTVELDEDTLRAVDTCPAGQACLEPEGLDEGDCVDVLPRRWEFAGVAMVMPDRKPDGDCWDAGCGAPDPLLELYVNDAFVGDWGPHQDRFEVSTEGIEESFLGGVDLVAGDELSVVLLDADLSANDAGLVCTLRVEAEALKRRLSGCEEQGFAIAFIHRMAR